MAFIISTTTAIGVGKAIGAYLMGKGGDFALEQASFKKKVKQIIRKDKKYIRGKFSNSKYREYPIEEFLLEKAFQTLHFLYPFKTFPQDKSDELYGDFCNYVSEKDMDLSPISENAEFRKMLEDCVDYHNVLVHQIILSPSQQLIEKDIKEYMTATGYAGHTLDPTAEILAENSVLEYTHRQIDGILRTLRMDLRFYRLTLLMCTIGLTVLVPIVVALYADYRSVHIAMIAVALCSVAMSSISLFGVVAWRKVIYCEKTIQKYTEVLWEKNFSQYSHLIDHDLLSDSDLERYRLHLRAMEEYLAEKSKWLDKTAKRLEEKEERLQR